MERNVQKANYFRNLIEELRKEKKSLTLEERKELFRNYVKEACSRFKVSIPSVNFDTIEHFNSGEDGHFHPELCMICVDEDKLRFLKEDKIKELAYHEVTHAFQGEHNTEFWDKMKKGLGG